MSRADFAEFYGQGMPRLVRFIMRHGADPHEAADVAQASFALAFEQWSAIKHPAAWLRSVAFRHWLRLATRREQPADPFPDRPGGCCPVAAVELAEEEARMYEALSWLSMKQRQAMAWHLDGFSAVETAEQLGVEPEAVRQNLVRARANLRKALGTDRKDGW